MSRPILSEFFLRQIFLFGMRFPRRSAAFLRLRFLMWGKATRFLSNRQQENKYCLTEVRMGAFFRALAHSCRFMTVLLICSLFQIPTKIILPGGFGLFKIISSERLMR